ncbi:MAG: glycosyltransferase family 2 protein [Gammaproteobacteria bacterium]|nr:glycosyltransferase family 2 protein [Gammaproteobacteria bacterium]MBU0788316.1 glycosyltransferase family 2 protein [Gammaproteobacteria bacterium]MBU0815187.1 glycosyltransferase family 2 protein [Gammaproteobacteria bacterium]MBU1785705.1 glycosyltransferase family 2 protein [Gammaproteobacteria bacterium]
MNEMTGQKDASPRISVVCPVYNSRSYVQNTVDALFAQSHLPSEFIVVDDGSSDGTPEFLQAYVANLGVRVEFILLRNEHRGPGAARNAGISCARGDWIAFLDSDDIWLPDKLFSVAQCLHQYPEVNFVCHHEELIRSDRTHRVLAYAQGYHPELPLSAQLYRMNLFSTSAVVCRRDLLLERGLFDEALMSAQDYELWLRLSPYIRVKFVEKVLGQYVERPGNITSGSVSRRLWNELRIAWRHRRLSAWHGVLERILRIFISYGKQYLCKWPRHLSKN